MLDLKTIEAMAAGGIDFIARVDCPGGAYALVLKPSDVATYLTDRKQLAADFYGGTKVQYREWVQHDGTPRCGGKTVKGTPCRNYLSGFSQLPSREWLKRDGGYCAVHGGEGSEEARARGFGERDPLY